MNRGVRQGCILAPALFNVFLDHTLRIALDNNQSGVNIRYTLDGEVYVKEYDKETEIEEVLLALLYADDMAIVCDDAEALKRTVVKLEEVMHQWGLEVSAKKTEVLSVDRNDKQTPPDISLHGQPLKNVNEFKYLGTYFTSKPTAKTAKAKKQSSKKLEAKPGHRRKRKKATNSPKPRSFNQRNLDNRLAKANGAFYSLAAPLYRRKDIQLRYKLRVFKMAALPTLLYGSEIWSLKKDELSRLES